MKTSIHAGFLACVCSVFALSNAYAQQQTLSEIKSEPKAVESKTSSNSLVFKSTLEKYKPYTDEKIQSWKGANDEVGKIGGWRAYLKEANEPEAGSSHADHGSKKP
jgi:hypothetical protein